MNPKLIVIFIFVTSVIPYYQIRGEENPVRSNVVNIPMADSTNLKALICFPEEDDNPRPVVLMQTPYGKEKWSNVRGLSGRETSRSWIDYYLDQGFTAVVQDMRGTSDSEGEFMLFMNASTDGYDTIKWIKNRDWCDGCVTTYGGSAMGISQYLLAGTNPDGLTGQIILVASPDLYKDAIYQGGALRKELVEGWLNSHGLESWIQKVKENELYNPFWYPLNLTQRIDNVNVPAIHVGGWYDLYTQGSIDGFSMYQYHAGNGARGNSKLIIGPWSHHTLFLDEAGEVTYSDGNYFAEYIRLIEDAMKAWKGGESSDFKSHPTVSYYIMGAIDEKGAPGNKWCYSDEWPIPANKTSFYLSAEGGLKTEISPTSALSFLYDPKDPVVTIGGSNLFLAEGPKDQSILEYRADILVFQTEILQKPVGITGRVSTKLYVSSDCIDTDFTVKLTDVYPDGRSMLISDGIQRARFREGNDHIVFLTPGEITELCVDLQSTSYIFNKGHRIQIAISSSNCPRFDVNPNTGEPLAEQISNPIIANNTVYFGSSTPSQVILPLINIEATLNNNYFSGKEINSSMIGIKPLSFFVLILVLVIIIRHKVGKRRGKRLERFFIR